MNGCVQTRKITALPRSYNQMPTPDDKTNTHISQDYLNFTLFEKEQKTADQWFVVNLIFLL